MSQISARDPRAGEFIQNRSCKWRDLTSSVRLRYHKYGWDWQARSIVVLKTRLLHFLFFSLFLIGHFMFLLSLLLTSFLINLGNVSKNVYVVYLCLCTLYVYVWVCTECMDIYTCLHIHSCISEFMYVDMYWLLITNSINVKFGFVLGTASLQPQLL